MTHRQSRKSAQVIKETRDLGLGFGPRSGQPNLAVGKAKRRPRSGQENDSRRVSDGRTFTYSWPKESHLEESIAEVILFRSHTLSTVFWTGLFHGSRSCSDVHRNERS